MSGIDAAEIQLHLTGFGTKFDAFCISSASDETVFTPKRTPMRLFKPVDSLTRAVFHLFNWPDLRGPENYVLHTSTPCEAWTSCGRFGLMVDGWQFSVAATGKTSGLIKALNMSGGFAITHVGTIQRADGSAFTSAQIENVLGGLSYFFSFALGRWSSPCLTVGYDASGEHKYCEWGMSRCEDGKWPGDRSWFDKDHSEQFAAALPGFWRLWSDKIWHRSLTGAIYWYVHANRAGASLGVDSAILFSQAALELLSWTYCVLDKKLVTGKKFKSRELSAAKKLRLLASNLGIPLDIPRSLTSLNGWTDSMDAITGLRNGLVHPGRESAVSEGAYYDGWRLSMWYLDLILLRLCGYNGMYANRLARRWVGQVEPVPWNP